MSNWVASMPTGVEPFLKWAGGKRALVDRLLPHFPAAAEVGTYFEPFLGGGAVFFSGGWRSAVLSDVNAELIETYETLRANPEEIIERLRSLKNEPATYYRVRAARPRSPVTKAVRFIYLNKTCFNGLYRVNMQGAFNVPHGRHKKTLVVCDVEQLRAASRALQVATFAADDFEHVVDGAREGDFVYFDPPYTTAHTNNGFIEYNAKVFSWEDQHRLLAVVRRLVSAGVRVRVSNADHSSIASLYSATREFKVVRINRWSTMAGQSSRRFPTSELLIVGDPR